MKTNYTVPFFIVSTVNIALILVNVGLQNKIDKIQTENKEINSQFIDLQCEYELVTDEVLRLEDENQILGSYVATVNPMGQN